MTDPKAAAERLADLINSNVNEAYDWDKFTPAALEPFLESFAKEIREETLRQAERDLKGQAHGLRQEAYKGAPRQRCAAEGRGNVQARRDSHSHARGPLRTGSKAKGYERR